LSNAGGDFTAYAIETIGLSKTYHSGTKRLDALKSLDLQIDDGYVFGFIGPNGAGKTTTIKSLMGLIKPTGGEARIFGLPIGTVESKNKIGYLSEVAYYYNFMEAENLLHFYGALRAIPREERSRRINENLEIVGLADRKKTRLKEYSKGMLQRFGIALALIGDPPLLLLDEPTSGLDPIGQKEMKDIIISLKSRGKSIFFSSHQLTEVERICDRIGIIHQGRMLESGPLDHFLQHDTGIYTLRCMVTDDAAKELESRSVNIRKDENDDKMTRITANEKDLPELIGLIQNRGGKLLEVIAGPGDLEELFVQIIRKGEQKA
jgi:ABC-2 type transport system ATP-binding protein